MSTYNTFFLQNKKVFGEFCSNGHGPFTKMVILSIFGKKHLKIFFSRTKKALRLNLGVQHQGLEVNQVCSNDDPRFMSIFLEQG